MKRSAALVLSWGLILLALAPVAGASYQVASVDPLSGPAGTEVIVTVSDFGSGATIDVRAGSVGGATLATGLADAQGNAGILVTIPEGAPLGPYVLYVCGPCTGAVRAPTIAMATFNVTLPITTLGTVTTPVATLSTLVPLIGDRCDIPPGATVIDFDLWDRSMGETDELMSDLQNALFTYSHPIWFHQWDRHVISSETGLIMFDYLYPPRVNSVGYVIDNPARDLWTTSPPMVMRLIDDTHWTLITGWGGMNLVGQPDYFGFNVGFGHFGEGMETPEDLVVELRVRTMPMERPDATILDQGAWDTVSITLGPGPQPVAFCLMATNTIGSTHWKTAYLIDILPRTTGGDPVHIPVDIDDLFYGSYPAIGPSLPDEIPELVTVPSTITVPEVPIPTASIPIPEPDPVEPVSDSSDLVIRIAFGLAGLIIGAGAILAMKRPTGPDHIAGEGAPPPPPQF